MLLLLLSACLAEPVLYGSVFKLRSSGVLLHSHKVRYSSGSGQQSVTGLAADDDDNSFWRVRSPRGSDGSVLCGAEVILEHLATNTRLHSHAHRAPMSQNKEVSAFDGQDAGDVWRVACSGLWEVGRPAALQHVAEKCFLATTSNTFGQPIAGHREIVCGARQDWTTDLGVFLAPADFLNDEL